MWATQCDPAKAMAKCVAGINKLIDNPYLNIQSIWSNASGEWEGINAMIFHSTVIRCVVCRWWNKIRRYAVYGVVVMAEAEHISIPLQKENTKSHMLARIEKKKKWILNENSSPCMCDMEAQETAFTRNICVAFYEIVLLCKQQTGTQIVGTDACTLALETWRICSDWYWL